MTLRKKAAYLMLCVFMVGDLFLGMQLYQKSSLPHIRMNHFFLDLRHTLSDIGNITQKKIFSFQEKLYIPVTHFDKIFLERTQIFLGGNPQYTVTIYGNGRVDYLGKKNTKVLGAAHKILAKEDIKKLVAAINEAKYSLSSKHNLHKVCMTDAGFVSTFIKIGIRKYVIGNNHGSCDRVSQRVAKFEDEIDKIVGTEQWAGSGIAQ